MTLEQEQKLISSVEVIKSRVHRMPCEDHELEMKKQQEKIDRHEAFLNKMIGGIFASNIFTAGLTFFLTKIFH